MEFWTIVDILRRRKWFLLAFVAVVCLGTWGGLSRREALFEATSRVMPTMQQMQGPVFGQDNNRQQQPAVDRQVQLSNFVQLATSLEVAGMALDKTKTTRKWDITNDDLIRRYVTVRPMQTVLSVPGGTAEEVSTDVLQIGVRSPYPKDAVALSRAMAEAFQEYYGKLTHESATKSTKLIESDLAAVQRDLTDVRAALDTFVRQNSIAELKSQQQAAVTLQGQIQAQYDEATAAASEAEQTAAALRQSFKGNKDFEAFSTTNPYISNLQANLAQKQGELEVAISKYRDAHPVVQGLRTAVAELQKQLDEQLRLMATQVNAGGSRPGREEAVVRMFQAEGQAMGSRARANQLRTAVDQQNAEISRLSTLSSKYEQLTSDQELYLQEYGTLQNSLRQAKFAEMETDSTGAILIIDRAADATPVGGNRLLIVFYAFILATVLGSAILIGVDYMDTRVRTSSDAEKLLQIPVAAMIPQLEGSPRDLARLTYIDPLSPASEAYRFLRTDLLFTAEEKGLKTLMVAGIRPGQGATTPLSNLAIAIAQSGKTTVLIDADLRRPSLHEIFGVSNKVGLTNALGGEAEAAEVMQKTDIENLAIIPAGPLPSNPSELLGSSRLLGLIETLKAHVDYVLFDTPPASAFSDAAVLSSHVDGVLFVIRAEESPTGAEHHVKTLFEKAKANVIGVVLNGVSVSQLDTYGFQVEYQPLAPPKE